MTVSSTNLDPLWSLGVKVTLKPPTSKSRISDEFLACQIGPDATKPLDEDLGGDEPFETGERIILLASGRFEELLIVLDHSRRQIPRKRHHLRDAHAAAGRAGFVRERLAADERHVQELRVAARRACRLDERRTRFVRGDHHHTLRLDFADRFHGRSDVDCIAFDGTGGEDLHVTFLHRSLDARQPRLAIVVVLIKHRDAIEGLPHELADELVGLVVVAGADVEDIAVERVAQRFGAGERSHERNLGGREDRFRGVRGRRADIAEEQKHAVIDKLLGIGRRAIAFVAIVDRTQLDFAAVDAPRCIDRLEIRHRAGAHLDAELLRRAGERRRLAEQDRRRGNARVCRGGESGHRREDAAKPPQCAVHRSSLSSSLPPAASVPAAVPPIIGESRRRANAVVPITRRPGGDRRV